MEKVKFSPGPWVLISRDRIGNEPVGKRWAIQDADEFWVATIETHLFTPMEENVRLMAAAPEMYEALKEIEDELDSRYDGADDSKTKWMGHALTLAQSALAKADGKAGA